MALLMTFAALFAAGIIPARLSLGFSRAAFVHSRTGNWRWKPIASLDTAAPQVGGQADGADAWVA